LYIASLLEKRGYDVRVFDIYPYDDRDFPKILGYDPDMIGMTVLTDYVQRARSVAAYVKKNLSSKIFVIGGVHVTALPQESVSEFNADIGVIGEGEYTMLELCDLLSRGQDWHKIQGIIFRDRAGQFVRTAARPFIDDLDEIPLPARHLIDFRQYLIPPGMIRGYWADRATTVMTSRGCPFTCIWCGSQCTFGRKVRSRSIDNVMLELEELTGRYGVDAVWFVDDTFTLRKDRVLEFCRKLRERGIKIAWGCQAHVKTADEEMFRVMKDHGLVQLDFGVESGSDHVLRCLHKNSDAHAIKRAFSIAKKVGVRTCATFMFGSPGEKKEDVEATFKLAREINPNFTSSFFITPYPGTELMDMAVKQGWNMSGDRSQSGLKRRPMLLINFNEKELFEIRKNFQKMFAWRNFASCIFNVRYLFKALQIVVKYPLGLAHGFRAYCKSFVFDDFLFAFLIYYVMKRADRTACKTGGK